MVDKREYLLADRAVVFWQLALWLVFIDAPCEPQGIFVDHSLQVSNDCTIPSLPRTTHSHCKRPLLLKGHTRPIADLKYNADGDIIFIASKDQSISAWYPPSSPPFLSPLSILHTACTFHTTNSPAILRSLHFFSWVILILIRRWTDNGERIGTYEDHTGSLWCIDISSTFESSNATSCISNPVRGQQENAICVFRLQRVFVGSRDGKVALHIPSR